MPIVPGDWSVTENAGNYDIRYIGGDHGASPTYATVLELHRFLQDLADDALFSGDDEVDITVPTPSVRSTDNIITLINGFNIDDTAAEHLYLGSIIQAGGATIYDGFNVIGGSDNIQIIQNGAVLSDDWWNSNGGLNADSANGISHRFMLKVRAAGADIDGRRIIATSRNFGNTFGEFGINGSARGINVIALTQASDLNNQTAAGTVATWSDIVNDNEGYTGIDADGNSTNEFYYSNWELGSRSKNNFYERLKWLTREGSAETVYGLNGELFRGITHQIAIDNPTGTFVEPEGVSWTGGTGQLLAIDSTTAGTTMWIQLLTGAAPTDGQTITGASTATADVNVTVTERAVSTPFVGASTGSAIIGAYGLGIGADDLGTNDRVTALDNVTRQPPNNVTFTVNGLISGEDRVLVGPESGAALNKAQMAVATTALTTANITSVEVNAIPTETPSSGTIRVVDNNGQERRLVYTGFDSGANTFTIDPAASEAPGGNLANVADFDIVNANIGNNVYVSYIDADAQGTLISAGSFVNDVEYKIETVGTTDFTLIGAASNTIGEIFTATGAGTGTGDARLLNTSLSFTAVYTADAALFIRVRDGGAGGAGSVKGDTPIQTFETTGTLGSAGGSTNAIRTSDA